MRPLLTVGVGLLATVGGALAVAGVALAWTHHSTWLQGRERFAQEAVAMAQQQRLCQRDDCWDWRSRAYDAYDRSLPERLW